MSATAPIKRTNGDTLKKEILMKMSFTEISSSLSWAQTFTHTHRRPWDIHPLTPTKKLRNSRTTILENNHKEKAYLQCLTCTEQLPEGVPRLLYAAQMAGASPHWCPTLPVRRCKPRGASPGPLHSLPSSPLPSPLMQPRFLFKQLDQWKRKPAAVAVVEVRRMST